MAERTKVKRFRAVLEKGDRALGWTIVRVPFDPAKEWSAMRRLRVRGEANGFPFRTSLFPDARASDGLGGFYLLVNRTVQAGAHAHLGDLIEITLQPDLDPREAELPDELAVLIDDEPGLRPWYDALSEYTRREIGKWVLGSGSKGVKGEAARIRRAEQVAERLLSTMDAERELPPIVAVALRLNASAQAGWTRMTDTQRRNELMAVFYYQSPEARHRRVAKLVEKAAQH